MVEVKIGFEFYLKINLKFIMTNQFLVIFLRHQALQSIFQFRFKPEPTLGAY